MQNLYLGPGQVAALGRWPGSRHNFNTWYKYVIIQSTLLKMLKVQHACAC